MLTILHLLTQTTGVGHLCVPGNTYANIADYIVHLKGEPVGEEVLYSCPAYVLMGKILEKFSVKE
jgi:CubicO group peptidase (beta-lactamase class C family)